MSCNEGIVIHAESDLYYTGGTIIIDHGHGVKSIYAHLSSVNVAVNQKVSKRYNRQSRINRQVNWTTSTLGCDGF